VNGPLTGVKVLDVTTTFSGPYCTQLLGDYGADVIKVERPGTGDITRALGRARSDRMGSVFLGVNRNKRSITLDLKDPADRQVFTELAGRADVLVHNMRPAAMARLGLSYEDLAPAAPRLVYCVITGYGSEGRYAGRAAYDDIVQGQSGLAALQGEVTQAPPTYYATAVGDKTAGLVATTAVLAALVHRDRTGRGQEIEVPMFESLAAYALAEQLGGRAYEPALGPTDYARMRSIHRRPYETKDGYICVAVYTSAHWKTFLEYVGRDQLLQQPEYATEAGRSEHTDDLYAIVAEEMTTRTTDEWLDILFGLDIPAGPLQSLDDLFEDPHLNDVGFFEVAEHPTEGRTMAVRNPVRFRGTPLTAPGAMRQAPALGANTEEVLAELRGTAPTFDRGVL